MNSNVINPEYQIPFGRDGVLAILGTFPGMVLFIVKGGPDSFLDRIPMHTFSFSKNSVFAYSRGERERIWVFEYSLRAELQNPRRLLKSVRNKLMGACRQAEADFEQEQADMEHSIAMTVHPRPQYLLSDLEAQRVARRFVQS